jgi:hypothetical protein
MERTRTTITTEIGLQPGEKLDLNLDDKMIEVARIAASVGVHDEYENLHPQGNQASCCR